MSCAMFGAGAETYSVVLKSDLGFKWSDAWEALQEARDLASANGEEVSADKYVLLVRCSATQMLGS